MKIKTLDTHDLLKIYPAHAYYDIAHEQIAIPDKDLLWKSICGHEYIHYLRRNALTMQFNGFSAYFAIISMGLLFMVILNTLVIFPTICLLFLIFFSYYYEEVYIQKQILQSFLQLDDVKFMEMIKNEQKKSQSA